MQLGDPADQQHDDGAHEGHGGRQGSG